MKNTLQRINRRVNEAEDQIGALENKEAERTQSEQRKKKEAPQMRII